jgi:hypothetical protein
MFDIHRLPLLRLSCVHRQARKLYLFDIISTVVSYVSEVAWVIIAMPVLIFTDVIGKGGSFFRQK